MHRYFGLPQSLNDLKTFVLCIRTELYEIKFWFTLFSFLFFLYLSFCHEMRVDENSTAESRNIFFAPDLFCQAVISFTDGKYALFASHFKNSIRTIAPASYKIVANLVRYL